MKYLQLLLWGLGSLFLASEAVSENYLSGDKSAIYQANKFKCPLVFGAFPDPEDCAHYYVCVAGISVHKKCGFLQNFDMLTRRCMPRFIAVCGNDKTKTTSSVTDTTTPTSTGDNFKCPKFMGSFPHPNDCSKYYSCMFKLATLKTCPENQLFDTAKSSCKPENEVNCDTRQRPGLLTSPIPTELTPTEVSEASSTEEVLNEITTEIINTEEITTQSPNEIINTEEITTQSPNEIINTEEITTQSPNEIINTEEITTEISIRPTGPPDHSCDEEDVDCIITETGDIEVWFICPRDIGSFPHPSSDKLFIFCMNWIPSVKKCGLNMVYSKEMSTCIETTYFAKLLL